MLVAVVVEQTLVVYPVLVDQVVVEQDMAHKAAVTEQQILAAAAVAAVKVLLEVQEVPVLLLSLMHRPHKWAPVVPLLHQAVTIYIHLHQAEHLQHKYT